jgi:hypothetical protein
MRATRGKAATGALPRHPNFFVALPFPTRREKPSGIRALKALCEYL